MLKDFVNGCFYYQYVVLECIRLNKFQMFLMPLSARIGRLSRCQEAEMFCALMLQRLRPGFSGVRDRRIGRRAGNTTGF